MTNRIVTLPDAAQARGAITLSAGNAGQAYAWAGRAAGVAVTVVMPAGAVRSKVDACLGYGARVVLHGTHVGETLAELERIREAEGLTFVHPFDDPAVIAGHGSIGLELVEDLPDVDVVVVGVGGGGLISGVAAAVKERRPTGPRLRRRTGAFECAVAGDRARRDRADPAGQRRRRSGRAVRRGLDPRDVPALPRWDRPARRPDDPGGHALRARTAQAGPRAGGCGRAGRGARRPRCRSATANGSRSCCRAGTSRSAGSASCSPARGRCPGPARDRAWRPSRRAGRRARADPPRRAAARRLTRPRRPRRTQPIVRRPARRSTRRLIGASFDLLSRRRTTCAGRRSTSALIVLGTVGPFALASLAFEVATSTGRDREVAKLLSPGAGGWYGAARLLAALRPRRRRGREPDDGSRDPRRPPGRPAAHRPPGPRSFADGRSGGRRRLDHRRRSRLHRPDGARGRARRASSDGDRTSSLVVVDRGGRALRRAARLPAGRHRPGRRRPGRGDPALVSGLPRAQDRGRARRDLRDRGVLLVVLGLWAGLDIALRVFDALGLGVELRAGRPRS